MYSNVSAKKVMLFSGAKNHNESMCHITKKKQQKVTL